MPPQPAPAGALLNKSVLWNEEWRSSVGSKPRPLWVLPPGSHDGPADTYKVKWSERGGGYSHNYADAEDVRDDEAAGRAARAQDVDAGGPPAAAEPLNEGLRLLEAKDARIKVVKKERDEAKEDAEEQEELAGQLVQSENAKMTQIDELKTAVSRKDARIGELETSLQAKDETIAELRGRVAELESKGVPAQEPEVPPPTATWAAGDRVRAFFDRQRKLYPAVVAKVYGDRTYDINYDDGDQDFRLEEEYVRPPAKRTAPEPAAEPAAKKATTARKLRRRGKEPPPCKRCGQKDLESDGSMCCTKCRICRKGTCVDYDDSVDHRILCFSCYGVTHTNCMINISCGVCGFTVCEDCDDLLSIGCGADGCDMPRCPSCATDVCHHNDQFWQSSLVGVDA